MSLTREQRDAMAVLLNSLRSDLASRPASDAGKTALAAADDLLGEVTRQADDLAAAHITISELDRANEELAGQLFTLQDELAALRLEAGK